MSPNTNISKYYPKCKGICFSKLTSRGTLLYLCPSDHGVIIPGILSDLSKQFSELIVSIFIFSQYFFNRFCPVETCGATPHCLYRDSLTLIYLKLPF